MIIPDKTTEKFLNKPASTWTVMLMCRTGLLPASDYLRAAALFRHDDRWAKMINSFFKIMMFIAAALVFIFLMFSRWEYFYRPSSVTFFASLLIFCMIFKNKSDFAYYGGMALIGLLIFIPDLKFNTNNFLFRQFILWACLIGIWEAASIKKNFAITGIFFNLALGLLIFQSLIWDSDYVLTIGIGLLFATNLISTFIAEKFDYKPLLYTSVCFILVELVIFPFIDVFNGGFLNEIDQSFAICLFISVFGLYRYTLVYPNLVVARLIGTFVFMWTGLLLIRIYQLLPFSPEIERALLSITYSVILLSGLILMKNIRKRIK